MNADTDLPIRFQLPRCRDHAVPAAHGSVNRVVHMLEQAAGSESCHFLAATELATALLGDGIAVVA